jgi:hypothetical protein
LSPLAAPENEFRILIHRCLRGGNLSILLPVKLFHMKKLFVVTACIFLLPGMMGTLSAQNDKKADPRHQNIYNDAKIETDELIIEIVDANAQVEFSKMKVKITNKTNDYILYKPGETEFVYDFGKVNPKGGMSIINGQNELIAPKSSESRVITAKDDTRFHVEQFEINVKGFYRIPVTGKVYPAPDFQLPASTNDFTAGPFKVLMTNLEKKTQQTSVRFKVTYAGDSKHYGLVNQGRVVCRIPNGKEFAMANSKDKIVLLAEGHEDKFNVYYQVPASEADMQFATLQLVWKDSFIESEIIPLKIPSIKMTLDAGKTAAKNK